jgi:ELWxxDGT repeat protein
VPLAHFGSLVGRCSLPTITPIKVGIPDSTFRHRVDHPVRALANARRDWIGRRRRSDAGRTNPVGGPPASSAKGARAGAWPNARLARDLARGADLAGEGHQSRERLLPHRTHTEGGTLFLTENDGTHGFELWRSNGTRAGTRLVQDINPSGDSDPANLTEASGALSFRANDGTHGFEL